MFSFLAKQHVGFLYVVTASQIARVANCSRFLLFLAGGFIDKKNNTSNLSTQGSIIENIFTFLESCSRFYGEAKTILNDMN